MGRGRPPNSPVRDRMQMIVDALGVTYGYEIHKAYEEIFEPIELRSMYYHLKKGVELNQFEEVGVEKVKGPFTWGDVSIRKYYILGPEAEKRATAEVQKVIENGDFERKEPKDFVSWDKVINDYKEKLEKEIKKKMKDSDAKDLLDNIDKLLSWLEVNSDEDVESIKKIRKKVEKILE
ncbi:MAG: hypothetical protein R6U26_00830 [Candidatus Undinarchaeales archaeon]